MLTCSRCQRVNPSEAAFCYFDGVSLRVQGQEPVQVGAERLRDRFVFPSGKSCHTLDELALGCLQDWSDARAMLQSGLFDRYLGGLGRGDLALAARLAAANPDPDQALDQFLTALPSNKVPAPVLEVSPGQINLGELRIGRDQSFPLELRNIGGRLLRGSLLVEDAPWLSVANRPQLVFQFTDHKSLVVTVRGNMLRARPTPLVGRLVVESTGGNRVVPVQAAVPVTPFVEGVLAGANTPRELAQKAVRSPREAARQFESGAVARWYQANGWPYPVRGSGVTGVSAVQQFLEALGVSRAPQVEISAASVVLRGPSWEHTLEVRAKEKRPVYAIAQSDQPWLQVGPVRVEGNVARIPLSVPNPPDSRGQPPRARVEVRANGNKRFLVPVELAGLSVGSPSSRPQQEAVPLAAALAVQPGPLPPRPGRKRPRCPRSSR